MVVRDDVAGYDAIMLFARCVDKSIGGDTPRKDESHHAIRTVRFGKDSYRTSFRYKLLYSCSGHGVFFLGRISRQEARQIVSETFEH